MAKADDRSLGMDLEALSNQGQNDAPTRDETLPSNTQAEACLIGSGAAAAADGGDQQDHFVIGEDGREYAGTHMIIDLWGASRIDDVEHVRATLVAAAKAAGATVLRDDGFHHFTPNNGVSGVVVLAESHISIHTWPERNFAALDVFMCGDAKPAKTVDVFKAAFSPDNIVVQSLRRGLVPKRRQRVAKSRLKAFG